MCVCIFVIPQDLWRCPCPSESSGLTPLASLLCPAPPIMNGCMNAAVFVGTRRKKISTSHVQVCLIWWEPGGVGAACRSHSRDFSCCPDWCQPGDLAPPSASVSEFPALSWKWKNISNSYFLMIEKKGFTWSCLSWLRRALCGMRGLSETGWTCNKEESCCCDYILS